MNWLNRWSTEQLVCVFGDPGFEEQTCELKELMGRSVRQWTRTLVSDPHETDECEAAVWAKILTGKNTFVPAGPGSALGWIRAIAENEARDHLRHQGREKARRSEESVEGLPADGPGPESICQEQEAAELIHCAIRRLPTERQAVLVLTRPGSKDDSIGLGLMIQQEVADLLGCNGPSDVHRNLKSTRDLLRKDVGVTPHAENDP